MKAVKESVKFVFVPWFLTLQ